MNCNGLHCPGCGHGSKGGPGVVALIVGLVIIAASAKAIGRGLAEVAHVLVLVAVAGASVTVAAGAVIVGLAVRSKLRRIERATGGMRSTLASHGYRELPEPRAELPARADVPAKVFIHPPKRRVSR